MKNKNSLIPAEKSAGNIWSEKARFRVKNRKWLGYSSKIALRIMSAMEDIPGMNQKKLAAMAHVSPQQIHKVVKGQQNLTLESIAKFSDILGVELILFPSFKYNQSLAISFFVDGGECYLDIPFTGYMPVYSANLEYSSFSQLNYTPSQNIQIIRL